MYRIPVFLAALILVFAVGAALAQDTSAVELRNKYSGKCLAVRGGSTGHGAALIHTECGTESRGSLWEMRSDGVGYRIVNRNSGLCLGVEHQSKSDGAVVTQVAPCDRVDTLWKIENLSPVPSEPLDPQAPPVDFVIRNNNSDKCLALVTGTQIKQYGCPPHRAKTTWQFQLVEPKEVRDVKASWNAQVAAWNRGDLNGYMAAYWNSPDLTFFGNNNETRGWEAILERYRARYQGEGKHMGALDFPELAFTMLGPEAVLVHGRWHLKMPDGKEYDGMTSVVFRKLPEGWRIVHDHSSTSQSQ